MGLLSRMALGVAGFVVLWSAGCSAGGPGQSPQTVDPVVVATTSSAGVSLGPVTAGHTSSDTGAVTSTPSTTTAGPVVATTAVTGPSPSATTTATTAAAASGDPTITYRVKDATGAVVTLTTNGAAYILPAGPSIELAPSLVVSVTVPPGLDTHGVDVDAAIAAYRGHLEVGDKATHDPTQDWRAEAAKYAMEPLLSAGVAELEEMASKSIHSEGHVGYSGLVTAADPHQVELRICNDTRGIDWLDNASGISVKQTPGDRRWQHVVVSQSPSREWLVQSIRTDVSAAC